MMGLDCDYVADTTDMKVAGRYDIESETQAIDAITGYMARRLVQVREAFPQPNVLMLSGGIDSILLAAVASSIAQQPDEYVALTLALPGSEEAHREAQTASLVAGHLKMKHEVIEPSGAEWLEMVTETVMLLESADPWEVLAGATVRAIDKRAAALGLRGALIGAAGADALFLGGEAVDMNRSDLVNWWDLRVRDKVRRNFTRNRFIPDFYERIIPSPERHIQVWQTVEAYDLALRIHPNVVRGAIADVDKQIHRKAAIAMGVPAQLTVATKSPMQVSNGGIESLVQQARAELHQKTLGKTYTDPESESLEFIVSRLWLQQLQQQPTPRG